MNPTTEVTECVQKLTSDMPFPPLYFLLSAVFFIFACFWIVVLQRNRLEAGTTARNVNILLVLAVFVKSLLLFFHSLNYYVESKEPSHAEGASLVCTALVFRVALLSILALLACSAIGMFDQVLAVKEKMAFVSVLILQVLTKLAAIIVAGDYEDVSACHVPFFIVDMVTCVTLTTVAVRVQCSRHALHYDGHMARACARVCITIVIYLVVVTMIQNVLPMLSTFFRRQWVDELLEELAALTWFVVTAWKFRPELLHPYLALQKNIEELKNVDTLCHF